MVIVAMLFFVVFSCFLVEKEQDREITETTIKMLILCIMVSVCYTLIALY